MTEKQFWNCSPRTYKAYREAYRLRLKHENTNLWLQGMYIYHALCDVAPIFHDFAKRGTKAHEYLSEPIALTKEEVKERKEREERENYEKVRAEFMAWAKHHNEQLKEVT